jgi:3-hydroxy-9,10-secoandrosta-1,3,5(10)-triene-9,17-dione monooxygenase
MISGYNAQAMGLVSTQKETTADVVKRARGLFDLMRTRAREAEDARHLLPDMVEAFTDAGLIRVLVPRRFGGQGLALTDALDVTIEVSRAYGSMGWVGSFWSDHPHWVGLYPDQAQTEVWGEGPDPRIATSFVPVGKVTPTAGGYRLSGEWGWASGVGFSSWVMLGGMVPRDGAPPQSRLFLVRTSEVTVVDTWFNAGLRGTGSDNVVAEDVFVPEHRTLAMEAVREGRAPGLDVNTDAHFRAPLMTHAGYAMVGPAIGIARGMIEDWSQSARAKAHSYTREQVAAALPMQLQLGESAAQVDTAEHLVRRCLERVQSGEELGLEDRVRHRRDISFSARLLTRAVDDLMQTAGASALREESPIQRGWRDVRTIACHVMLNFNAAAENYGRMALGLPLNPRDPFF